MCIKEALKEFMFECEIRNFSKRTTKTYYLNILGMTKYIEVEFKVTQLEEVTSSHIKQYLKYLKVKGLASTYVNTILKSVRSFFKYCTQEDYIRENTSLKVSFQREGKVLIKTFEDAEIVKMLKHYDDTTYLGIRNRTILATLVDTGLRNTELCELKIKNINKETGIITIVGKGNKERQLILSATLRKMMMKHERVKEFYFKDKNIKNDYYFLSRTGEILTKEAIERIVKTAGVGAGVRKEIRCSPHTIRHYFAQAELRHGIDVYSLSRLLGHDSIDITKRYLQSIQDKEILKLSIKTSPLSNL